MSFPSASLKRWYEYIKEKETLRKSPKELLFPFLLRDEITPESFNFYRRELQYYITMFWANWIDEVMKSVCDAELYKNYTKTYPCPKIYIQPGPLDAELYVYYWLGERTDSSKKIPEAEKIKLIKQYKDVFWGDVQAWLESIGREEIRDKAIKAFQEYEFTELGNLSPFEGD